MSDRILQVPIPYAPNRASSIGPGWAYWQFFDGREVSKNFATETEKSADPCLAHVAEDALKGQNRNKVAISTGEAGATPVRARLVGYPAFLESWGRAARLCATLYRVAMKASLHVANSCARSAVAK